MSMSAEELKAKAEALKAEHEAQLAQFKEMRSHLSAPAKAIDATLKSGLGASAVIALSAATIGAASFGVVKGVSNSRRINNLEAHLGLNGETK